jgi:hypothetical protein
MSRSRHPQEPTLGEIELALKSQSYFAGRVTFRDQRHAEIHEEINHLLDEWQATKRVVDAKTPVG